MNGRLGQPYKFIYSARNFVSGLTDIIALVKYPNGSSKGTYSLTELSGSLFLGTYYFDLPTTQNDPEGEYTVILYEQTSGFRQIAKVSMTLPTGTIQEELKTDLIGTIIDNFLNAKIIPDQLLKGLVNSSVLYGKIVNKTLNGSIAENRLNAKLNEDLLTGKILEC